MLHTLALFVLPATFQGDLQTDLTALARPFVDSSEVPSLVLAWIASDGTRGELALGRRGRDDPRPTTPDAVFELGSLTKLFTGLLLARAVTRNELALADPMEAILPASMHPRTQAEPPVRLVDLATHTSGMPDIPGNLERDLSRFVVDYSGYSEVKLTEFLQGFTPKTPPGSAYVYSNVGYGVLGYGLAQRAGATFDELVTAEINEPLGLTSTAVDLAPAARERLLVGHDDNGDPVGPMEFASLFGCGALRGDAQDLLRLLAAFLTEEDPLNGALGLARTPAFRLENGVQVALAWNLAMDGTTFLHDGRTAGFSSFVSFDRVHRTAVVVLANGATNRIPELGVLVLRRLLGQTVAAPVLRVPIAVTAEELQRLVGDYAGPMGLAISVTREADRLYAQIAGQPSFRLRASGPGEFFYRDIPASVSFELGAAGSAGGLVLHQNGRDYRCQRLEVQAR